MLSNDDRGICPTKPNTGPFKNRKDFHHSVKYVYFELKFLQTSLLFIVLLDFTKKPLDYQRSNWLTFENIEIFRFSKGPKQRFPLKFFTFLVKTVQGNGSKRKEKMDH